MGENKGPWIIPRLEAKLQKGKGLIRLVNG